MIRAKFYHADFLKDAPIAFQSAPINSRGFPETKYTLQVYAEDCTGCNLCVEVCPATSLTDRSVKAINMAEKEPIIKEVKENITFLKSCPGTTVQKLIFQLFMARSFRTLV